MVETAIILTLGKQERNLDLLSEMLDETGYDVEIATTLPDFDANVENRDDVTLAILDVSGFTSDIWTRCEQLEARSIPALILAVRIDSRVRERAMDHGINTVLEKPVRKAELRTAIRGMIDANQTT